MSTQQMLKAGAAIGCGIGSFLAVRKWNSMDCDWTTFHSEMKVRIQISIRSVSPCSLLPFPSIFQPEYFRERVIWITGASAGIGLALCRYLCSLNVNVRLIVTARREPLLKQLQRELVDKYWMKQRDVMVLPMDLNCSDIEYLRGRYHSILSHFGVDSIDILINNAGFRFTPFC